MSFEAKLESLTPETARRVEKLLRYADRQGITVERIDSAYRNCGAQDALADRGITPARGCRSWHTWGRAVDLYLPRAYQSPTPADVLYDYEVLGDYWKKMGGKWGGDFSYNDSVHFEWHPDMSINEICPSGYAACGIPPWPDDRPWYIRGQLPLGVGMAALGIGGAFFVWKSI